MALHGLKAFDKFVLALPGVIVSGQWEAHVAKVGGKVFAVIGDNGTPIVFKVSELSFDGLTSLDGIGQAAYFAKRSWVSVDKGAELPDADIKAYITEAHRLIAGKLTRKLRAELGIGP
ncbi:MAG: MmcQ/YjbR family DNA-binding protein [Devosia sp.]